ncbi:MAG TPA: hypothetical protein VEA44_18000 [Caulobacter sp.]|nr:hypothetical protein [Caulobacter sp.]
MLARTVPLTAALLTLAGCATPLVEPPGPTPSKADCSEATPGYYWLTTAPDPARQGGELLVSVWRAGQFPGSETLVPTACLSDWQISHPAVRPTPDGVVLKIAPDAPVGTAVKISAAIADGRATGGFTIVGAKEVSLAGTWTQTATADCPVGSAPIGELTFTAEGRFSVTWIPFEAYKDYWGPYRFNAATGTLGMQMEGGNHQPADVDLQGRARLGADGVLRIEDVNFGAPRGEADAPTRCAVFRKR